MRSANLVINNRAVIVDSWIDISDISVFDLCPQNTKILDRVFDAYFKANSTPQVYEPVGFDEHGSRIPCLFLGATVACPEKVYGAMYYFFYIDEYNAGKIGVIREDDRSSELHLGIPLTRFKLPQKNVNLLIRQYKKFCRNFQQEK